MRLSPTPTSPKKPPIRFGGAGASVVQPLTGVAGGLDKVFRTIGANRGREMIVEDLIGFGFLRTGLDLLRGYFYGSGTLNIPAAGERLFRESTSIFTDNVLSGLAAKGLGSLHDKGRNSFSSQFVDYPTLELFKKHLTSTVTNEQHFLNNLSSAILADNKPGKALTAQDVQDILKKGAWKAAKLSDTDRVAHATELAKKLGLDSFDIKLNGKIFQLDNLLEDLNIFKKHLSSGKSAPAQWNKTAKGAIKETLAGKNKMLWCVGLGMASTFSMPFLNVAITKLMYGLDYYPGEMGLRKAQPKPIPTGQPGKQPSFMERHFPYVMSSLKDGNLIPALLTLAPLPFAFGAFDTEAQRFINPIKKNWLTGLKDMLTRKDSVSFGKLNPLNKKVRNLFDFSKRAPFTSQQQMASIFALLITSRLLCSRGDNEFKERLLDSFAGWGLWILGTPFIKKMVAKGLDANGGTQLLKTVNGQSVLRTRAEIENLLKDSLLKNPHLKDKAAAMTQKTLKAHVLLGAGSTIASMLLLGILTPLAGMWLTKKNELRKQQQESQKAAQSLANKPSSLIPSKWPAANRIPFQPIPFAVPRQPAIQASFNPYWPPMQAGNGNRLQAR